MGLRRTSAASRVTAIGATAAIHLAVLLIAAFTWTRPAPPASADELSVFTVPATLDAEPKPEPQDRPIERPQPDRSKPETIMPEPEVLPRQKVVVQPVFLPPKAKPPTAAPAIPVPTTIPPAPPPPAAATDVNWESRVLAHIDRHKRYPKIMGSRRPRGTAFVLFRMDRSGMVLSARVEQSSGNDALDRAAVETVKRAVPLPRIPADRPSELQLSVPIEFFTK